MKAAAFAHALTFAAIFAAPPSFAASEADCAALWQTKDANADNILTSEEGSRDYATSAQQKNLSVSNPGRMTRNEFITHCKADAFSVSAEVRPPTTEIKSVAVPSTSLLKGANSFTESQAKARIEASGFTGVGALSKDVNGIWRGAASKDGKSVNVGLDFQGNVAAN